MSSDAPGGMRYRVRDVPLRQRPRELFDRLGAQGVSDDVLLAIILRTGIPGTNVIDLARELLVRFGSLAGLADAPIPELMEVGGMGPVKAQVLLSSFELARRLSAESNPERSVIDRPESVADLLREDARRSEEEVFWVIMLDTRQKLLRPPEVITRGLMDATLIHPREVFKQAIRYSCASVILVHNHPSGDPSPSPEDIKVTRQLVESGHVLQIRVLDHIILGKPSEGNQPWFTSLRETGLIDFGD